jgi:hypothetical protein
MPRNRTGQPLVRTPWIATGLTALAMTNKMPLPLLFPSLRGALATKQSMPRNRTSQPLVRTPWIATGLTALAMTNKSLVAGQALCS